MQEAVPIGSSERILAAARRRFERQGFRRTGVAEIAADAGLAPGSIYGHFRSKEELFRQVIEADYASWLARARAILGGPGTGAERISRLGLASVELYRERPLLAAVLRRDAEIVLAPLLDELHERVLRENVAMLAEVVEAGIRDGSLRPVDPEKAAYVLFAVGRLFFDTRHHAYEDLAPVMGEILLRGITAP